MTVKQYISQITAELGGRITRRRRQRLRRAAMAQAGVEHISFLANPKYKHEVHDSKAGAVIVSDKAAGEFTGRSLIVATDPYLYFAKVARLFSPVVKRAAASIRPPLSKTERHRTRQLRNRRERLHRRQYRIGRGCAASWRMPSSSARLQIG